MGRPLSGTELMRVHGFCLQPDVAQLQKGIVKTLAGDTISVAPIGCVLALTLANTSPMNSVDPSEQLSDHHVAATWIGPSSRRGFDRNKDKLMHLAGVTFGRKASPFGLRQDRQQIANSTEAPLSKDLVHPND